MDLMKTIFAYTAANVGIAAMAAEVILSPPQRQSTDGCTHWQRLVKIYQKK